MAVGPGSGKHKFKSPLCQGSSHGGHGPGTLSIPLQKAGATAACVVAKATSRWRRERGNLFVAGRRVPAGRFRSGFARRALPFRLAGMASGEAQRRRSLWERLRGGRLGRWWRGLLQDYAEAAREALREARRRPGRAAAAAGLLAGVAGCARGCPGEASLEAGLLEASGRLLLLSPATRSGAAEGHVQRLLELRAGGRLRVRSLGLAAVAYEAPFDADAALYRARCPHLAPAWAQLPARLLDVGFCGRWWLLRAKMRDCDVNAEEFRALPPSLRRLSFHHLHSARNERLFQQKFQPVVLGPGDLDDTPPQQSP
ncbi:mitochondrial import inner membrane translocase subunit Tim29 [Heteronotia binoei]|uniref:mitochondrial import inner membrane translocase subunit Tim29 n=1 Tax=Heteronotia binoei TaxID=13085 RepID=UPI002930C5D9|nr:mitochondrial import inner membrane translocase subunit Tim29 [Heteronotia binoei]